MRRLIAISILLTAIFSSAQTVTLNDASTVVASPYRLGLNIGDVCWYSNCNITKNIIGNNNPNMEAMEDRRVYPLAVAGTTTTFTSPINYDNYPPNYFAGAGFTIIYSQNGGAQQGCTGTIASNTNANWPGGGSTNPIFTTSAPCPAAFSIGDIVVVKSDPTTPATALSPTPESVWEANENGLSAQISGGGKLTSLTTGLCATCGAQSLVMDATSGTAGFQELWDTDNADIWVMINGTYQITYWAKIGSGTPTLTVTATRSSAGGLSCSPTVPPVTSTWTLYTLSCTGTETQGTTAIGPAQVTWSTTGGAIDIDNVSFQKTGTDPTNTTVWRDEVINDLKLLHPGTLRYWITHQNGISVNNWTLPSYQRFPSMSGTRAYGQPAMEGKMMPSLEEFLTICQIIGADPYIEVPVTWTGSDFANFIEFLAGDNTTTYGARRIALGQTAAWTTVFNTIHLDFCNECWNTGFNGENLPFRSNSPSGVNFNGLYYDYAHAMYIANAAMRGDAFYSLSKMELVANAQTAQTFGWDYYLANAPVHAAPDTIEIQAYYYNTINQFDTDAHIWQPEFVTPFVRTVDVTDPDNFNQSMAFYLPLTTCGTSGTATCKVNTYEWGQGTIAGSVTQTIQDSVNAGAGDIIPTALVPLLNMQTWAIGPQNRFSFTEYTNGGSNSNTAKLWGAIVDAGGATNNVRPAFQSMQLVNKSIIGTMFACPISGSNTFNFAANTNNGDQVPPGTPATNNVPLVYAYCFKSGTTRSLVLINTDIATPHTVTFAGTNTPTGTVTTRQIAPSSLGLLNEANSGSPTNTTAMATSLTSVSGSASSTIALPAFSVTALDYSLGTPTTTTSINGNIKVSGSVVIR